MVAQQPGHQKAGGPHGQDDQRSGQHDMAKGPRIDIGPGQRCEYQRRGADVEDQTRNEIDGVGVPKAYPGIAKSGACQYRGHDGEQFGEHQRSLTGFSALLSVIMHPSGKQGSGVSGIDPWASGLPLGWDLFAQKLQQGVDSPGVLPVGV